MPFFLGVCSKKLKTVSGWCDKGMLYKKENDDVYRGDRLVARENGSGGE